MASDDHLRCQLYLIADYPNVSLSIVRRGPQEQRHGLREISENAGLDNGVIALSLTSNVADV